MNPLDVPVERVVIGEDEYAVDSGRLVIEIDRTDYGHTMGEPQATVRIVGDVINIKRELGR